MAVSLEVKIRVARDPERPTYHGETTFSLETELEEETATLLVALILDRMASEIRPIAVGAHDLDVERGFPHRS